MKKDGRTIYPNQYRRAIDTCIDVNSDQNDEKIAQYPKVEGTRENYDKSDTKNILRKG